MANRSLNYLWTAIFVALSIISAPAFSSSLDANGDPVKPGENAHESLTGQEAIDKFTQNLTTAPAEVYVGNEEKVREVFEHLGRATVKTILILSDPGEGKSALVAHVAHHLPDGYSILSLDFGALKGGTELQGRIEARSKTLLQTIADSDGKYILFIDEAHMMMKTPEFVEALKTLLATGRLTLIMGTTYDEAREHIEPNKALMDRSATVKMPRTTPEDLMDMLRARKKGLEQKYGVKITERAIQEVSKLTFRYFANSGSLRRKANEIMELTISKERLNVQDGSKETLKLRSEKGRLLREMEALHLDLEIYKGDADINERIRTIVTRVSQIDSLLMDFYKTRPGTKYAIEQLNSELQNTFTSLERKNDIKNKLLPGYEKQMQTLDQLPPESLDILTERHVQRAVSEMRNETMESINMSVGEKIEKVSQDLKSVIFGQDPLIDKFTRFLKNREAKTEERTKPMSILIDGDSGVGKTFFTKTFTKAWFGTDRAMFRINGTEYKSKESATRLIGSDPGFEDSKNGGLLTEAVRQNGNLVILIDEIEKMNIEVLETLMTALDEGEMKDARGRTIDFRNVILVGTTNASKVYAKFKAAAPGGKLSVEALTQLALMYGINVEELMNKPEIEVEDRIQRAALERAGWKSEFINRWGLRLIVNSLTFQDALRITKDSLEKNKKYFKEEYRIKVEVTDALVLALTKAGFDQENGARPIDQAKEFTIRSVLADLLIDHKVKAGDVIHLDFKDGGQDKGGQVVSTVNNKAAAVADLFYRFEYTPEGAAARAQQEQKRIEAAKPDPERAAGQAVDAARKR